MPVSKKNKRANIVILYYITPEIRSGCPQSGKGEESIKDVHKPRCGVSAAGSRGEGSSEIYSNTN